MFRLYATCLLLVAGATSSSAEETALKWKFKEGETFYVENTTKSKQSLGFGETPVGMEKTTTAVSKYKVVKTTSEEMVLEMQFFGFKSDGKDLGSVIGGSLGNNLKDVTFRITLNKAGQVTKFEGIDEFIKKLVGNDEATVKAVRAMGLEDLFSQGVTMTFGFLPAKGVTKGDKWKQAGKVPLPLIGSLKAETEFVYLGPGDKGEEIAFTQQLTFEIPEKQVGTLFRITKGDLKAEPGKGLIIFDAPTGRLVRSEQSLKLKGTFTVEVGGKEQTLNIEDESTQVIRLLSENPLK